MLLKEYSLEQVEQHKKIGTQDLVLTLVLIPMLLA